MHDPDRTIGLILEKTPARFSWSEETPWAWTEEEYEADVETYRTTWGTRARAIDEVRRLHPSMADDRGYVDWWHRYQLLSCAPGACVAQTRKYRPTGIRSILLSMDAPICAATLVDAPITRQHRLTAVSG
jgi:hypothetical protein